MRAPSQGGGGEGRAAETFDDAVARSKPRDHVRIIVRRGELVQLIVLLEPLGRRARRKRELAQTRGTSAGKWGGGGGGGMRAGNGGSLRTAASVSRRTCLATTLA